MLDLKKLTAIMRMTESQADGEALNALRLANRMLAAEGKNWGDVLGVRASTPDYRTPPSKRKRPGDVARQYGRPVKPRKKYDPDKGRNTDAEIGDMLDKLRTKKHDLSTMMFLASLTDHWQRKDYLTDAQFDVLKRMHEERFRW